MYSNSQLRVLLLAIWNSKKDIALLLSVIVISCLVCGPMIYFLEIGGGFLSPNKETNLIDIPTGKTSHSYSGLFFLLSITWYLFKEYCITVSHYVSLSLGITIAVLMQTITSKKNQYSERV